jgi:hypothetical protein
MLPVTTGLCDGVEGTRMLSYVCVISSSVSRTAKHDIHVYPLANNLFWEQYIKGI